jgi:hypothetical protein
MSKQLNLRLGSNIPEHIKAELRRLRADCVRRSEEHHRKQRILDNAERYETWQEIQLASLPIKGRR